MRKTIYLAFAAIAVGAMFFPLGPVTVAEAGPIARVPEPSSLILLATGFTVLARYLRK